MLADEIKRASSSELRELRDYFLHETSYAELADMEAKLKAADEERASREMLIKKLDSESAALEARLGGEIPDVARLEELKRKASKRGANPLLIVMTVIGGAMLVGGAATMLLSDIFILAAALLGVGLVLAVAGIVLILKGGKNEALEDMKRLGLRTPDDIDTLMSWIP